MNLTRDTSDFPGAVISGKPLVVRVEFDPAASGENIDFVAYPSPDGQRSSIALILQEQRLPPVAISDEGKKPALVSNLILSKDGSGFMGRAVRRKGEYVEFLFLLPENAEVTPDLFLRFKRAGGTEYAFVNYR